MKNLPSARLPERARGAGKRKRRAAARAGAVRKDAAPARGKGRRRPKVGRRRAFGVVAAANHGPRAPLRCDGSGKRRAAARAGGVRKGVTATAGEKGGRPKVGRRRAFGVVAAANHGSRAPLRCDGSGKRRAAARAGAVRKDAAPARGKGRRRPKVGRRRAFGVVAAANHGPRAPLRCDGSGRRRAVAKAGGRAEGCDGDGKRKWWAAA